jgi:hypothetical protein
MLITTQQGIVEQLSDALRLIISPNTRIKVRRAALDDHDDRIVRRAMAA